MFTLLNDFFSFVANPKYKRVELSFMLVLKYLVFGILLSCITYIIILLCILLINALYDQPLVYKGADFVKSKYNPFWLFIIINILAPLIEELAFRLPLKRKKAFLYIALTVLSYFVICIYKGYSYYSLDQYLPIRIGGALLLSGVLYFLLKKCYFRSRFSIIVYLNILLFSLLHVLNYSFELANIPLLIVKIIPQLFLGLLLSYFRVRLGFLFACGFHILNNIIF